MPWRLLHWQWWVFVRSLVACCLPLAISSSITVTAPGSLSSLPQEQLGLPSRIALKARYPEVRLSRLPRWTPCPPTGASSEKSKRRERLVFKTSAPSSAERNRVWNRYGSSARGSLLDSRRGTRSTTPRVNMWGTLSGRSCTRSVGSISASSMAKDGLASALPLPTRREGPKWDTRRLRAVVWSISVDALSADGTIRSSKTGCSSTCYRAAFSGALSCSFINALILFGVIGSSSHS